MTRSVRVREDVELGVRFFNTNASSSAAGPLPAPRPSAPLAGGSSAPYFARSFNSNVVLAMVVLLLVLVVASFVNTVVRVVLRRRRQRDSAQQQVEDKGLDSRAIEALPVVAYGADSRIGDDVECVVCLSEFAHGEKLRILPECYHAFHVACIDAWLATHKTCPVCRQSVARSARFGSTRIANVDIEAAQPDAPASSHTNRSFRSILPSEAVAILVHAALGSRRFGLRSQGG